MPRHRDGDHGRALVEAVVAADRLGHEQRAGEQVGGGRLADHVVGGGGRHQRDAGVGRHPHDLQVVGLDDLAGGHVVAERRGPACDRPRSSTARRRRAPSPSVTSTATSASDHRRCRPPPGTSDGAARSAGVGVRLGRVVAMGGGVSCRVGPWGTGVSRRAVAPGPPPRRRSAARRGSARRAAADGVGSSGSRTMPSNVVGRRGGRPGRQQDVAARRRPPSSIRTMPPSIATDSCGAAGGPATGPAPRPEGAAASSADGVGRELQLPAGVDQVGIGEAAAVALRAALVDLEDLGPPERVAQVALGDVPQRVAPLHLVDRQGGGGAPRRSGSPRRRPRPCRRRRRTPRPAGRTASSGWAGPEPGMPLAGQDRAEQRDPGDEPRRAPLEAAGERHGPGLAAAHVGHGLDQQRDGQLEPDDPADEGEGLHQELVGDVGVAQGVGDVGDGRHRRGERRADPGDAGRPARRRRSSATPTSDSRPRPTSAARVVRERSSTHRRITLLGSAVGSASGSPTVP